MTQPLSQLMSGLSISKAPQPSSPPRHHASTSTNTTNKQQSTTATSRLPSQLLKYQNTDFIRPKNTGLTTVSSHSTSSHSQYQAQSTQSASQTQYTHTREETRSALFKIAGVNNPLSLNHHPTSFVNKAPGTTSGSSPNKKQYTAHEIHGPAHSTASRAFASSITHSNQHVRSQVAGNGGSGGIGKYDGGLERDEEKREAPTGEGAKILELESANEGYVTIPQSLNCLIVN